MEKIIESLKIKTGEESKLGTKSITLTFTNKFSVSTFVSCGNKSCIPVTSNLDNLELSLEVKEKVRNNLFLIHELLLYKEFNNVGSFLFRHYIYNIIEIIYHKKVSELDMGTCTVSSFEYDNKIGELILETLGGCLPESSVEIKQLSYDEFNAHRKLSFISDLGIDNYEFYTCEERELLLICRERNIMSFFNIYFVSNKMKAPYRTYIQASSQLILKKLLGVCMEEFKSTTLENSDNILLEILQSRKK